MKALQFVVFALCIFFYPSKNHATTSYRVSDRWFQPMTARETNLQDSEMKPPSISIALASLELSSQSPGVVELRIENTTQGELRLSEPSDFILEEPQLDGWKRTVESHNASTRLWECLPKTSKPNENWVLLPGESFQCKIDLKKLNWRLSKSAVYNSAPVYPAGDLFHEVPRGHYKLYFELENPPVVIRNTLKTRLYRSNELSVTLDR